MDFGTASAGQSGGPTRRTMVAHVVVKLVVITSLLGNWYLIGLMRHSPNSYAQLKAGGTAAYPGLITRSSASSLSVKTANDGVKTVAVATDTPYAIFPKDYQTLIPVGLPSSRDDIVVKQTEASVSAQLPYLQKPQALRVNLVRSDMLTGKVIEVSGNTIKFKGFAASGAQEETRTIASSATFQKLGTDGKTVPVVLGDVTKDMGLYAFLSGPASDATAQITKLIVADFSTPSAQ